MKPLTVEHPDGVGGDGGVVAEIGCNADGDGGVNEIYLKSDYD